jgi:hypothetical protein
MKVRSTLAIACLGFAFLMIVGATRAQAESCCYLDALAAPFVAAAAVVETTAVATAAVVTAPFTALSCGTCGVSLCNTCSYPKVAYVPSCDHC